MLYCGLKFNIILIFSMLITQGQTDKKVGDSCIKQNDNIPGTCKFPADCPTVIEEYRKGTRPTICGYDSKNPIVCCPVPGAAPKSISVQKCEEYSKHTHQGYYLNDVAVAGESTCEYTEPLIIGGEETKKGEFPHMAAIGWRSGDGTLSFKCGGSLISHEFVLTAAHCSKDKGKKPSVVRLGDHNLKNKNDGMTEIDIPIAEFISHENFNFISYYYDIAVIRMANRVEFNDHIRPACLWHETDVYVPKVIATGWGYTEALGHTSDYLKKVEIDVFTNSDCNDLLKIKKLPEGIVRSQICAGVKSGGSDTCNGDSGGPIQTLMPNNSCMFQVVGITSVGNWLCGRENYPSVYTRVSFYLHWIEERVWGNKNRH